MIVVDSLRPEDRDAWEILARGYKEFYKTPTSDEQYEATWRRLSRGTDVHGIGAYADGRLVGIAHYLYHVTVWGADTCYLQDLFVDPNARGRGAARALIHRVGEVARERGVERMYWTTKEDNATARALYDRVGRYRGFVRYEYERPAD
ncbi:MAG TPA: GNAT family N-acetyltransferase [Stackebrandtia sp.]|jgi:GNAT superfamily N-acetyltransferase|uniref:GNAT family N-acetyltransferase n=1 Tax=Stackebrandtia sp. TaxID=2023065 RepID=UPI002D2C40DD|nr:GNAT family N-acetyltransferase [Stackebrandtia sp.]HZE40556.1 GNAT family N-acetyltransferase [Stackebrandtia sp.]